VHLDVKPANLMLDAARGGQPSILGLCAGASGRGGVTRLWRPGYLDIQWRRQQFADARSVDTRADVYSLACTLPSARRRPRLFPAVGLHDNGGAPGGERARNPCLNFGRTVPRSYRNGECDDDEVPGKGAGFGPPRGLAAWNRFAACKAAPRLQPPGPAPSPLPPGRARRSYLSGCG